MGKVKKATSEKRKAVEESLIRQQYKFLHLLDEMKQHLGDHIRVRTIFKDDKGRFISPKKARELQKEGKKVTRERAYYIKRDLPEFNLKKGDQIPEEIREDVFEKVKEDVKYHNTIVGVMIHNDLTWDDAKALVDDVFQKYEDGEIDHEEVHEILSP